MCKQKNFSIMDDGAFNHYRQQGFSLVIVMMIMLVIALLVIAGAQVSNTEMRISTNNADQKYAKGLAERALLVGEDRVLAEAIGAVSGTATTGAKSEEDLNKIFKVGGNGGLYGYNNTATAAPRTAAPIWEETDTWWDEANNKGSNKSIEAVGVRCDSGCRNPRYIIEYLGTKDVDGEKDLRVFRVTARAWGENENSVSTLQSVIVAPSS